MAVRGVARAPSTSLTLFAILCVILLVDARPPTFPPTASSFGISQQPSGRLLHGPPGRRGGSFPPPCPEVPYPLPDTLNASSGGLRDALDQVEATFQQMFSSPSVNATGAIVTIVYGDQTLRTLSFGVTDPGPRGKPIDEHSIFAIGSVSKLFPVYSLFQLRDAGAISLGTQVDAVNENYHPHPFPSSITKRGASLADLGSHMSGLGRYAPCEFGNCNITTEQAIDRMNNWTLQFPPGGRVSYCNTGFSLLGRLLESIEGCSFEQYVTRDIVKPLGMNGTLFAPPAVTNPHLARAYVDGQAVPPPSLGWSVPAGGIYSTASDMRTFLQSILRWDASAGSVPHQLLDGATLREWLTRRVWDNPTPIPENSVYFEGWGIPWQIASARYSKVSHHKRYFLYTKDGSVPGYHTQVMLAPDIRLGVFATMTTATSNHGGSFYDDVILESTFNILPAVYAAAAGASSLPQPSNASQYVGKYVVGAGAAAITIAHSPDGAAGLTYQIPLLGRNEPAPLVWLGGHVFNMGRAPSETCFQREGGNDDYNIAFQMSRQGGAASSLLIQGLTILPWTRVDKW